MRQDNRNNDEIRPVRFTDDFIDNPLASVLIEMGRTKVLCTVSLEEQIPRFLMGKGRGWLTAEYSMLPGSTHSRKSRDISRLKMDGRSTEIQRLIGRSLRSVMDMTKLGERQLIIDCDVLQADGGTRTAAINGGYRALRLACQRLLDRGILQANPLQGAVAAISVGIVGDVAMTDLCYLEDSQAQVDMNVIMDSEGRFIEVQGTGESRPFTKEELTAMLSLAQEGIHRIFETQGD